MQREAHRQRADDGAERSSVSALRFDREARGDVFGWKWRAAFQHRKWSSAISQALKLSSMSRPVNLFGHGHERGRDAWEKENLKNRLEATSKEPV